MRHTATMEHYLKQSPFAKHIEPSPSDVHVNRPLTEILINWQQDPMGFVADRVFPLVPVGKQTDLYWEYVIGSLYRDDMAVRSPGTESAGSTHKIITSQYACITRALHEDIADQVRANQDMPLNEDAAMTMILAQKARVHRERTWANSYFTTNVWTYEVDGAGARSGTLDPTGTTANDLVYWNASAGVPIQDVRLAAQYIRRSGMAPNVLVLGREVYDVLVDHEDIVGRLDRGQTVGPAMANRDSMARLFDVDEILVMDGIYNDNVLVNKDADNQFIGGKNALLCYRAPRPSRVTPSAGYTFSWQGYIGATPDGTRITRMRMEHLKSDRIEIEASYDQKLVAANLGFFFRNIVQ